MRSKNPNTKVVNGREVKNIPPQNIKEESALQQRDAIDEVGTDKSPSESNVASGPVSFDETLDDVERDAQIPASDREVKGFTGTGGAGGAGSMDREVSNRRKNGGQIEAVNEE